MQVYLTSPPLQHPYRFAGRYPLFGQATLNANVQKLPFKTKKRNLKNIKLFTGRAFPQLAASVAKYLGLSVGAFDLKNFPDGSTYARAAETVRGKNVFIIQPTCATPDGPSPNDNIMEVMLMLDSLRRSKAEEITVVNPFYGYSRGDRQVLDRESIPAKVVTDMFINGGADHLATFDIHNKAITGFTNRGFDNFNALMMLAQYVKENFDVNNTMVMSPDDGGIKRAKEFAAFFGPDKYLGNMMKKRNKKTQLIEKMDYPKGLDLALIKGKTVLLPDDMIDTAGTMCQAADELIRLGAKEVIAVATHGFFNKKDGVEAIDRINQSAITKVIVTDTVPLSEMAKTCDKLIQVSIAPMLAEAIGRMAKSESLEDLKQ